MALNRLYAEGNQTMPPLDVTPGAGAMGGAAKSGDPVVVGQIPGVLVGDAKSDGTGIIQTDGIFNLSVKGVDQSGNSAVVPGQILFFVAADNPPLSKKNTGVRYGYALGAVASAATTTIPVQVGY